MKQETLNLFLIFWSILFLTGNTAIQVLGQEKPITPIGLDAYRMWDQWPTQRIGTRVYMRSTYDRAGGNESADASHFLFANDENDNVTLDVKGKGVLYFFRANHWHGSLWHFVTDGRDNMVSESGTNDPVNAKHPSIDAPVCLFFGAETLYNREQQEYLVKGLPVNIRFDYPNKKIELGCYFPMPFFKSAKFELAVIVPGNATIDYEIRYEHLKTNPNLSSYFHATYKDIPVTEPGKDMVYLDTKGMEGFAEWSGSFVGNSFIFSHNGYLGTLEADPRFFFEDSKSPQAYGTGTEEWGGGGDYWGDLNMTLPLAGHPCGAIKKEAAKHKKDLIESTYCFLLADLMPFGKRAVIQFEHGGEKLSTERYECVSYWYGLPNPSLIKSDEFDVGNTASERSHAYNSPDASKAETISSRYKWGIDRFPVHIWGMDKDEVPGYSELSGKDIYPEEAMDGRYTRGTSEFTVKIDPDNQGRLVRRILDYSYPNQSA